MSSEAEPQASLHRAKALTDSLTCNLLSDLCIMSLHFLMSSGIWIPDAPERLRGAVQGEMTAAARTDGSVLPGNL